MELFTITAMQYFGSIMESDMLKIDQEPHHQLPQYGESLGGHFHKIGPHPVSCFIDDYNPLGAAVASCASIVISPFQREMLDDYHRKLVHEYFPGMTNFVFNPEDIFNAVDYYMVKEMSQARRIRLLYQLLAIPRTMNLNVCVGYVIKKEIFPPREINRDRQGDNQFSKILSYGNCIYETDQFMSRKFTANVAYIIGDKNSDTRQMVERCTTVGINADVKNLMKDPTFTDRKFSPTLQVAKTVAMIVSKAIGSEHGGTTLFNKLNGVYPLVLPRLMNEPLGHFVLRYSSRTGEQHAN